MRALHFDHAAIPIGDPAATYSSYAGALGLPFLDALSGKDWGGKDWGGRDRGGRDRGGRDWLMQIFALGDDRQLALIARRGFTPKRQRGLARDARHYAFSVDTDAASDAWRTRLAEAEVADWEGGHGDQNSLYFEDPNAIVLEITTPPSAPEQAFARDPKALIRRWIKAGAAP